MAIWNNAQTVIYNNAVVQRVMLNGATIWAPPAPVYSGIWYAAGRFAGAYSSNTGSAHGYAITPIVTGFTSNPSAYVTTAHGNVKYWCQNSAGSWLEKTSAANYFDPTRIHSGLAFYCKVRSVYSGRGYGGTQEHVCKFPFKSAIWTDASALSGTYYVSSNWGARTVNGVPDGMNELTKASGSGANAGYGAEWQVTASAASARFVYADSTAKCIMDSAATGLNTYKWATYYPNASGIWTASGVLLP